MNRRSKILAGSSIFAALAVWGSSLALGLAYSGGLFTLFPVLSSIGILAIGPILIATTALFVSLSLVLSISLSRSRYLEKKEPKEGLAEAVSLSRSRYLEKKESKEGLAAASAAVDRTDLSNERKKVKNFNRYQKKEYFEVAIKTLNKLAIKTIVSEGDIFKEVISTHKYGDILYYAASKGSDEAVKYIKYLGVDINKPSSGEGKYSPIYYAIAYNDPKALKCLIDNGADTTKIKYTSLRVISEKSTTPLMEAVSRLQKENVALLLSREEVKANIDAVDRDKDTALTLVFSESTEYLDKEDEKAQYDVAKLLLDNGADPTIVNYNQKTALSLAQKNNYEQRFISLLEEAEEKWRKEHKNKESYVEKVINSNQPQGHQK